MKFTEFPLAKSLLSALNDIGFNETTPIQEKALPILFGERDLIATSQTGSGKTAAYLIPMLNHLIETPNKRGLILVPTRELATQVFDFMQQLLKYEKSMTSIRIVGGVDIRRQFRQLQKKQRIIVATPGRLIDHLKRNTVQLNNIEHLVLDEGDRMIDMGFLPQLKQIIQYLPKKRQTSFFTATLDKKVSELANSYLQSPEKVSIGQSSRPVKSIRQKVLQVRVEEKENRLLDELNQRSGAVIVFFRTQRQTHKAFGYLKQYGFHVDQIHGGRTQGQRNKAISDFKSGKVRILCATDVASRGIDAPHVEHVINMDIPHNHDDYIHRIGRTARNGRQGEALSFVAPNEVRTWNSLVKKYELSGVDLPESPRKARSKKTKNFSNAKPNSRSSSKPTNSRSNSKPHSKSNGRPQRSKKTKRRSF
ncbi:MAG: DEAD/DEAH box helicase [Bdellovibrionales bacterium]|nr:DEAD/DEAH box helicase [Bdellovibrionales bacterium]